MRYGFLLLLLLMIAPRSFAQPPTWSDDVACIVFTHCAPCHHEGGAGHFNLTTYVDGYWWRNEMRDATQAHFMPPWPPDPAYRSLAHERVLTQDEIDIIGAWVAAGAPEGDPQNAPPPPVFTSQSVITAPDLTAIMEDYLVPPSTSDLYRCFVLPIDHPTDRYITGLEVIPGNTEVVHHVLVFQDTSGQAQVLDAGDIGPGYTSFGGIGVSSAKLVGIWVPGSEPFFTPTGMGVKLLANADLVIQVHYPATSNVELDSTRVNIKLAPPGFMRELAIDPILDHIVTITNGPLVIPPNVVQTFHAQYTIPIPGTVTAIGPHSHLLGKRMKSWAVKPGGEVVPLIDIPDWDFRWQGLYPFRRPIFLPQGTVIHGEATYDNTVDNPDNPNSPPNWVWLGEATTNEMMLFYFAWTFGFATDENIVIDDAPHTQHYLDCTPDFSIGLSELSAPVVFAVAPSPAHDRLSVTTDARDAEIRLIDVNGRIVLRSRSIGSKQDLAVNTLPRGMYTLELLPNGSTAQRIKVMLE